MEQSVVLLQLHQISSPAVVPQRVLVKVAGTLNASSYSFALQLCLAVPDQLVVILDRDREYLTIAGGDRDKVSAEEIEREGEKQ